MRVIMAHFGLIRILIVKTMSLVELCESILCSWSFMTYNI